MKANQITADNKVQKHSIGQIIIRYVTRMSILLGVILVILMIASSLVSTSSVLRDSLRVTARISAQNISSNIHLLTDRMDNMAQKPEWSDAGMTEADMQQLIGGAERTRKPACISRDFWQTIGNGGTQSYGTKVRNVLCLPSC